MKENAIGKNARNERRKVVAAFLNAAAIVALTAMCLTPVLANDMRWWLPLCGVATGLLSHLAALLVVAELED
ncbi:hypothetical protein ABIB57_005102 [Devosia sp. UYZn731]|uniref:hypothetical protein n=1 Tax=Devosia sp. UYZn731 TaxID=3156345 RepID=UPI0033913458